MKDNQNDETVVVLTNRGHPEDRAWDAGSTATAKNMVRWLRDNHIAAVTMSYRDHEALIAEYKASL